MSEKQQHTAASLREKMFSKYGDDIHHKHDKNHNFYRQHCKSHPCQLSNGHDSEVEEHSSTGLLRELKLRKIRKRLDKGRFH